MKYRFFKLFIIFFLTLVYAGQSQVIQESPKFKRIFVEPKQTQWNFGFNYNVPYSLSEKAISDIDKDFIISTYNGFLNELKSNVILNLSVEKSNILMDSLEQIKLSSVITDWLKRNKNVKISEVYRSIKNEKEFSKFKIRFKYQRVIDSKLKYIESEFCGVLNNSGGSVIQFEALYDDENTRMSQIFNFTRYTNLLFDGFSLTRKIGIGAVNQEGISDEGRIVPPPVPDDILTNGKGIYYGNPLKNTVQEPLLFCTPPIYLPLIFYELPVFAGGSRSDYDANLVKLKEKNRQIEIVNNDRFLKYSKSLDEYMQCLNEWVIEHRKWRSTTANWRQISIYTALLELK